MIRTPVLLALMATLLPNAGCAQAISDVPKNHAAANAVQRLVKENVLTANKGKFRGSAMLTREELTVALVQLAHALEARKWDSVAAPIHGGKTGAAGWQDRPVTRYDTAIVLDRIAAYVARGLPKKQPKERNKSEALPAPQPIPAELSKGAVGDALKYLCAHRMVWKNSPLLNPKATTITGRQLSQALAELVGGLTDQWSEEPKDQDEIPARPGRPI